MSSKTHWSRAIKVKKTWNVLTVFTLFLPTSSENGEYQRIYVRLLFSTNPAGFPLVDTLSCVGQRKGWKSFILVLPWNLILKRTPLDPCMFSKFTNLYHSLFIRHIALAWLRPHFFALKFNTSLTCSTRLVISFCLMNSQVKLISDDVEKISQVQKFSSIELCRETLLSEEFRHVVTLFYKCYVVRGLFTL